MSNSKRFRCTGHYDPWDGHELEIVQGVDVEEDDGSWIWFTFWSMGLHRCTNNCAQCDSWRDRIGNAWRMLRGKAFIAEEFVLEKEEAQRLAAHLFSLTGQPYQVPTAGPGDSIHLTNYKQTP